MNKRQANKQLIDAAEQGNLPKVKELVEKHGADIHADNDYALRWASYHARLSVVRYLVKHGADIHAINDDALRGASYSGHLSVVKYLVEHGADIHAYDDYALRWASRTGRLPIVKYLVENGANIHAKNDDALWVASDYGQYDVLSYLFSQVKSNKPKALKWHKELLAKIKQDKKAIIAMPGLVNWLKRSGVGK